MPDLFSLIDKMNRDRQFQRLANSPLAQFGPPNRQYLGATLLPERNVDENAFTEDSVRYRTVIANSGTRYSPTQKKGEGLITGTASIVLGESDIAREFTSRDYDALIKLLGRNDSMNAMLTLIRWVDVTVVRAMVELLEAQRFEMLVNAQVVRRGDNGYVEPVNYPNPAGHRTAAGGTYSSNAYDPYPDLIAKVDLLASKGYTVNRIIGSTKARGILLKNTNMINRLTRVVIANADGSVGTRPGQARISGADLNGLFAADGLPAIETYDLTYNTEAGSVRFFPDTVFLFLCTTGNDVNVNGVDEATVVRVLNDTLGYTAIGRPAGQAAPGRVIRVQPFENKPPRVEAEGWQTALPVMTEPEAIGVITGIA